MDDVSTLPGPLVNSGDTDAFRSSRIPLLAYGRDRETVNTLQDALADDVGREAVFRIGDIAAVQEGLRQRGPSFAVLIVDVCGEKEPLAALERISMLVEPDVKVFVIGETESVDFYRRVTRDLGVQEYLFKPLNRELIARTFLPAILGRPTQSRTRGRIVTVTGVRGGVGATTVAVNLAVQLSERSRHHTVLFDADLHGGTAALTAQGAAGGGLRVALEHPERVDALFIDRSSPAISDRLDILAAEENLVSLVNPPPGAARHLSEELSKRYNFIVTDLPRFASPLNHELRELANVRILVTDPTLAAIRDTLRFLAVPRGPHQLARPIVVLNRIGAPGSLTLKQITEGLGDTVYIQIPWLPKQLPAADFLGIPAVRSRGPFQKAIVKLSEEIMPNFGTLEPQATGRGLRRWWRK